MLNIEYNVWRNQIRPTLIVLLVTVLFILGLIWYDRYPTVDNFSITEHERAGVVAGIILGLDMAYGMQGHPPMSKERWLSLGQSFDGLLHDCRDMRCVMTRMAELRASVHQKLNTGPKVIL
jgi:hypothetical protein